MQNSRVIRRLNAAMRRCINHHRRLCQGVAELDQLFCQDEFFENPRRVWQLLQGHQDDCDTIEPESVESQESSQGKNLNGFPVSTHFNELAEKASHRMDQLPSSFSREGQPMKLSN
ncbi:hypothetical protein KR018_002117 [Drosophila ironensis]|nr:hypothetical protein KR018_002117 [Drosophila ironensis]